MTFIIPVAIVSGIGLLAGVGLTLASKFMAVEVNQTAALVREVLPGANCGACGYAGCDDYAEALAADSSVKANLCTPGGSDVAMEISSVLGVEFEAAAGKYAVARCSGTYAKTNYVMDFRGMQSCSANKMFYRGRGACSSSCLGYGDCVKACEYGAISMVHGVAFIDKKKCVGCSACVKKCPNKLIEIVPSSASVFVGCSNCDKGSHTRQICRSGCIGCMKCEKICKFDAIHVENNLAKIDYEKCKNCGMCVKECPVSVIVSTKEKKKAKSKPAANPEGKAAPKVEAEAKAPADTPKSKSEDAPSDKKEEAVKSEKKAGKDHKN